MMEVRPGLLVGGEGDALAVFARAKSITKHYGDVTHVLTVANERVDWESESASSPTDTKTKEDCDTESTMEGEIIESESKSETTVPVVTRQRFQTKFVCLPDLPMSDLLHHFESCCQFIKEGTQQGKVLVHCQHGVSRSVAVVLAYLMWSEGRGFKVLHEELKEKKPEIRPNKGFVEQLKLWEAMRCKIDVNNKLYKAYRLKHLAKEMRDTGTVENLHTSPDPFIQAIESSAYYRCRKCRRLLFTDESILQHELGKGQSAFKWHKRSKPGSPTDPAQSNPPPSTKMEDDETVAECSEETDQGIGDLELVEGSTSSSSPPPSGFSPADLAQVRTEVATVKALSGQPASTLPSKACSSFFLEPLEWMKPTLLGTVEGKILCPKCNARLGSFNWSGEQCSCGQWVTPSFQVHRARVDETRSLSKRKNVPKQT